MRCVAHPDQPALSTCRRCGDASCAACLHQASDSSLCPACQQWCVERRVELLSAERTVSLVGISIVCASLGWLAMCIAVVVMAFGKDPKLRDSLLTTWGPVLPLPPVFFAYGVALARVRTQRCWPAVIASVGMLPMFPSGTLVGVASLIALSMQRVREIFGKEHQRIIRSTPEVRLGASYRLLAVTAVLIWPVALSVFGMLYAWVKGMPLV